MDYIPVKQAAKRFAISERRIQKLCEEGRIPGATMFSNVWMIPADAKKPEDARITAPPISTNYLSLKDFCRELSISAATGKNWLKLGKIKASKTIDGIPVFSKRYLASYKRAIKNGTNSALKSRRNKKYISGNGVYKAYVSSSSPNAQRVQSLLDALGTHSALSTEHIRLYVAECALQLICQREKITAAPTGLLGIYLTGELSIMQYAPLIDDLIGIAPADALAYIADHAPAFTVHYEYELQEDILGLLYISLKNISSRKATGSYYTPTKVVRQLIDNLIATKKTFIGKSIIDPCCGTGNFLLQLPDECSFSDIYGIDIDAASVQIARINLALRYQLTDIKQLCSHITTANYLNRRNNVPEYDYIIGNPPWGYNFTNREKERLYKQYETAVGKNIESYDVFIEQAFRNLKNDGTLSFVLPEAILNVRTHTPVREIILKYGTIQVLEYLGNAFDKVQCPCIILQLQRSELSFDGVGMLVKNIDDTYTINTPREVSPKYFSFTTNDTEYQILKKITEHPNHTTLYHHADFALGIVTGGNNSHLDARKNNENEMILKGSDICKFRVTDSDSYISYKPETFQQVAPTKYYRAPEKLLYRFICSQLVFAYDDRQRLSLNSCNIVIPQLESLDIKYILAILNSRIAQFLFAKRFHSIKILRSHIEQIPLPLIPIDAQQEYIAHVDAILNATDSHLIEQEYNLLDAKIAALFGLTADEYEVICSSMHGQNLFLH